MDSLHPSDLVGNFQSYSPNTRSPTPTKKDVSVVVNIVESDNDRLIEENSNLRQRLHLTKNNANLRAANVLAEIVTWLDNSCNVQTCCQENRNIAVGAQIQPHNIAIGEKIQPLPDALSLPEYSTVKSGRSSPARSINEKYLDPYLSERSNIKSGKSSPARSINEQYIDPDISVNVSVGTGNQGIQSNIKSGTNSPARSLLKSGANSPARSLLKSGASSPARSILKSGASSPARSLFGKSSTHSKGQFRPVSPNVVITDESLRVPTPKHYTESFNSPNISVISNRTVKSPNFEKAESYKQQEHASNSRPPSAKSFGKRRGSVVYENLDSGVNTQPSEGFQTNPSTLNYKSASPRQSFSPALGQSDEDDKSVSDKEESDRGHGYTWEKSSSPFKPVETSTPQRMSTPENFRNKDKSQFSAYQAVDQKGTMIKPEAQFLKPEVDHHYSVELTADSMYKSKTYQRSVSPNTLRSKSPRGFNQSVGTKNYSIDYSTAMSPQQVPHDPKSPYQYQPLTPSTYAGESMDVYVKVSPRSSAATKSQISTGRTSPIPRSTPSPLPYGNVTPVSRDTRSPGTFQNSSGFESFTVPFSSSQYVSGITYDGSKTNERMKLKPTTRLIGEICFQLDRKILNYVFRDPSQSKRRRFYGYIIQNITQKIDKESTIDKRTGLIDNQKKYILQYRYQYILNALKPLGYDVDIHPDFCADMVNKYGLLPLPPERSNTDGIKPDEKQVVLDALVRIAPKHELRDIHVILDCLTLLATDDDSAIISF